MARFVEEFLYRGRNPASGENPAWHIVYGETGEVAGKTVAVLTGPVSVSQAAKVGIELPDILTDINAQMAMRCEELAAENNVLAQQNNAISTELEQLKQTLNDINQSENKEE